MAESCPVSYQDWLYKIDFSRLFRACVQSLHLESVETGP